MPNRRFSYPAILMLALLSLLLVAAVACAGAEVTQDTESTGATTGDTTAASQTQPQSQPQQPAQPQSQPQSQTQSQPQQPAQPTAEPQAQTASQPAATEVPQPAQPVPFATRVPAALPSQVVDDPINKDVYPDAEYGGILRRGGYYDPAHYDLLQVSSVTNSFKQMMLYNNILRYNPLDAGKTIIPDLATSWEVSEDGHTWTFPLREGLRSMMGPYWWPMT